MKEIVVVPTAMGHSVHMNNRKCERLLLILLASYVGIGHTHAHSPRPPLVL